MINRIITVIKKNKRIYEFLLHIQEGIMNFPMTRVGSYINRKLNHNKIYTHWYQNPYNGTLRGNRNIISASRVYYANTKFYIHGKNNKIIMAPGCHISNCVFMIQGDNNVIKLAEGGQIKDSILRCQNEDSSIEIGVNVSIGGAEIESSSGHRIYIGNDCLLSHGIDIRNDEHPIYDIESDLRINEPDDIVISNHVWIGKNVTILKGGSVAEGCVLGEGTLVNAKHSPDKQNSIWVGSPARCVKENIRWDF